MNKFASQNYISHHVGALYSIMWMQNVPQWEPGVVIPGLRVHNLKKTPKLTYWLEEPKRDHMNSVLVNKEITSL
jgi:hypothetical protein